MRIKINSNPKVNMELDNPVKFLVKTTKKITEYPDFKSALNYSNALTRLGIDNSIKLLFN